MTRTRRVVVPLAVACLAVGALPPASDGQAQAPGMPMNALTKPTVLAGEPDRGGTFFGEAPDPARTRHYYIAAEFSTWSFIPGGKDPVTTNPIPPHITANRVSALRYVQYTDASFHTRVFAEEKLGILGPVLRGVTGDFLAVTFLNRTNRPLSMHPHGVKYDRDSEGASYFPARGLGAAVGPGARFTYVWKIDQGASPRPNEPGSKAWLYHSHVLGDDEINLGLIGMIVVTDPARARPDGTPRDVDRELPALFMIFREGGSSEMNEMLGHQSKPWAELQQMAELGERPTINGYGFGNLRGLDMNEGERVRWYLFALGSEEDMHTAHWHGARVTDENGRSGDVVELMPASMRTVDMVADNPGGWLFHCHIAEHMMEGMYAHYVVHPKAHPTTSGPFVGLTRNSIEVSSTTGADDAPFEMRVTGKLTVYDKMALWVPTVKVGLGTREVQFRLNRAGEGSGSNLRFKALNAGAYGVIDGPVLEFELTFAGTEWVRELARFREAKGSAAVPLTIALDDAVHRTTVDVR